MSKFKRFWNKKQPNRVPRPQEVLQAQYQELCTKAGELQYRIKMQQFELDEINSQLQALNNEAFEGRKKGASTPKPSDSQDDTQSAPEAQGRIGEGDLVGEGA